jgi:signal peptidase I
MPTGSKPEQKKPSVLREYVQTALWVLVLTFALRAFVIQAFRIPSESMVPTLLKGDFLFVNKFEYGPQIPFTHVRLPGLRPPRRGDVIVFQYPRDPRIDYVKRCIATGGQTVEVRDKRVIVDGHPLDEPYAIRTDPATLPAGFEPRDNFGPYTLAPGELFMMGDNRDNSNDSRFWGPVKMELVRGRAMFIYFSTAGSNALEAFGKIRFGRLLHVIQ